jgi:hypothetical protein
MRNQSCGGDHIGSHAITNEEDYIPRLLLLRKRSDNPIRNCCAAIVVREGSHIVTRIIKSNTTVGFRGHTNNGGILREEALIPTEVLTLQNWFRNSEESFEVCRLASEQ